MIETQVVLILHFLTSVVESFQYVLTTFLFKYLTIFSYTVHFPHAFLFSDVLKISHFLEHRAGESFSHSAGYLVILQSLSFATH